MVCSEFLKAKQLIARQLFILRMPLGQSLSVHLAAARFPDLQDVFQNMRNIADNRNVDPGSPC